MKDKLLLVSFSIPFPLNHGGAIAQYFFIENLQTQFEIIFCCYVRSKHEQECINQLKNEFKFIKIIEIYSESFSKSVDCETPKSNFLFKQVKGRAKAFIKKFYRKKNVINSLLIQNDDFNVDLLHNNLNFISEKHVESLIRIIIDEQVKLIQFDFFETLTLLKAVPKGVKKIFVHHEIKLKRMRLAATQSSKGDSYKNVILNYIEHLEMNLLKDADVIIVFNNEDKEMLSITNQKVVVSPFGIPNKLKTKNKPCISFRRLLFIGSGDHYPNYEGLIWFLDTLKQRFDNEIPFIIEILGLWDDNFINKYSILNKITFRGRVKNIEDYYEQSILISPIFSGSGIRTKILFSFANYIPVVSSFFAAEGLIDPLIENKHLCLFKNADELFEILDSYITDNSKFHIIGQKGNEYYKKYFNDIDLINFRINAIYS
jgi:glycosyltransferase involved in cell wall biosynthesis